MDGKCTKQSTILLQWFPWILFLIRESNTFCVDNIMLAKTWFSINNVILPISFILLHCYLLIKYSLRERVGKNTFSTWTCIYYDVHLAHLRVRRLSHTL